MMHQCSVKKEENR